MKTRADQTEKHTFSRSRLYQHSAEAARQGGFHGRPQRSDPQNSETLAMDGHPRSSAREEGDGTQEVLPRTTTTLVGVEDLRNHAVVKSQRPKERGAQTADRVVVKYLDRRARAPTTNRRPRSGVGGARRGVREYGAVNYHKVELKEQKKRNSLLV